MAGVGIRERSRDAEIRSIVALIKPQFEAGRQDVARGRGVIRAAEIHEQVLREVLDFARAEGLGTRGLLKSPLVGPKGNVEFLAWLDPAAPPADTERAHSSRPWGIAKSRMNEFGYTFAAP